VISRQTGKFSIAEHRAFMKENGAKLRVFFPEADIKNLQRIEGLETEVRRLAVRQQETFDALKTTFSGEIEAYNPREIFAKIWRPTGTGTDIQDIQKLKRVLKQDPEMYRSFQAEVLRDMEERIVAGQDRVLSFAKLDNYLFGRGVSGSKGNQAALREVMGDKFMDGLETMHKAVQISQRTSPAQNFSNTAPVAQALGHIARIWTGMFTAKGRALTAGKLIARRASNRVLMNAVRTPEGMEQFTKLANLNRDSVAAWVILSELGGSALLMPGFGFTPDERDIDRARPRLARPPQRGRPRS